VPDFVAIIAGFEARSVFGRAQGHGKAGSTPPGNVLESPEIQARLRVVRSIFSTLFALLGNRFQEFGSKSSTSPLEGQVLETGTG
jgi:hypothetical protein